MTAKSKTRKQPRELALEVYKALDGWRWRTKGGNGEIVDGGSEAYSSRSNAQRAANARLNRKVKIKR